MTSVCFDALSNRSRQCEYAFARTVHANNLRQCETALRLTEISRICVGVKIPEQISIWKHQIIGCRHPENKTGGLGGEKIKQRS